MCIGMSANDGLCLIQKADQAPDQCYSPKSPAVLLGFSFLLETLVQCRCTLRGCSPEEAPEPGGCRIRPQSLSPMPCIMVFLFPNARRLSQNHEMHFSVKFEEFSSLSKRLASCLQAFLSNHELKKF